LLHCTIASLLHNFIVSFLHCFIVSLLHCFIASLFHCFIVPLLHCFTASLIHCFIIMEIVLMICAKKKKRFPQIPRVFKTIYTFYFYFSKIQNKALFSFYIRCCFLMQGKNCSFWSMRISYLNLFNFFFCSCFSSILALVLQYKARSPRWAALLASTCSISFFVLVFPLPSLSFSRNAHCGAFFNHKRSLFMICDLFSLCPHSCFQLRCNL